MNSEKVCICGIARKFVSVEYEWKQMEEEIHENDREE